MASSDISDDDFEDFDLLLGGEERVGSLEDVSTFTNSNAVLSQANVLTEAMKRWMKKKGHKPKDIRFFKDRKALQHKGTKIFRKMEHWYVEHVLKTQFKDLGQQQHARKLMLKDPVGVEDPPKDDDICWKSNPITTTTTAAGPGRTRDQDYTSRCPNANDQYYDHCQVHPNSIPDNAKTLPKGGL